MPPSGRSGSARASVGTDRSNRSNSKRSHNLAMRLLHLLDLLQPTHVAFPTAQHGGTQGPPVSPLLRTFRRRGPRGLRSGKARLRPRHATCQPALGLVTCFDCQGAQIPRSSPAYARSVPHRPARGNPGSPREPPPSHLPTSRASWAALGQSPAPPAARHLSACTRLGYLFRLPRRSNSSIFSSLRT